MQYLTPLLFHCFLPRLYSVLRAENTSSTPTSTAATTQDSKPNIVPLAVGITLGLLALVLVVLGALYLQRRRGRKSAERERRRKSALLDTSVTPLYLTSPAQDDQLSDALQESKRGSRPQNHASTPSWDASTATAVPTMSIGIPESGVAPSHEACEVRDTSGPA